MANPLYVLERSRSEAIKEADRRTAELHEKLPEIKKIDASLSSLVYAMYVNGSDKEKLASLKAEANMLREKRCLVLVSAGYDANYDKPRFRCEKCSDTGYIKLEKCSCLRELENAVVPSESTLGDGLRYCTFDTFSFDYYPAEKVGERSPRETMKAIYDYCREYASSFSKFNPNLIFTGGTGLGKTHLSASIGHVVSEKGMSVVYDSAQKICSDCRRALYSSAYDAADKYYDCDLLIIDDLGAEVPNDYTVSALTELINRRLVSGCPTIISTNLELGKINAVYGARLFSRIIGCFTPFTFAGKDIRYMKL